MKKLKICFAFLLLSSLLVSGCAGISTYPGRSNDPNGIRVYPQKIYLLVDKDKKQSKLVSLPDIKNAYEIKPWSFLSKHDLTIKITDAQVTELTSNQDSSAALSLLQKLVEVAGEAAKEAMKGPPAAKALAEVDFQSSWGFETGIYELDERGAFKRVSPPPMVREPISGELR